MNLRNVVAALLLLVSFSQVEGRPRGVTSVNGGPTGSSNINVGANAFFGPNGVEFTKGGRYTFVVPTDIQFLNASGFMNGTPTGAVSFIMDANGGTLSPGNYTLEWDAGIKFASMTITSALANCVATNVTINSGCGGFNTTVTASNGLAGSLTFDHSTSASFVFNLSTSGTYAAPPGASWRLYRTSDHALIAANIATPTSEFTSLILGTGPPRYLRTMGAVMTGTSSGNQQQSDEGLWINRHQLTDVSWNSGQYSGNNVPMGVTCGNAIICGTNTYTSDTSVNVTGSTWNDGDVVWAAIQNSNTGASTFALGSRPAVPICDARGNAITAAGTISSSAANGSTLTYNARLGCVLYHQGPPAVGVPIEAQVSYANAFNMGLWHNIPYLATDDYITRTTSYINANLSSSLPWGHEFCNELWNPAFNCNGWATNQGYALGFVTGSGAAPFGYEGLRNRQIADLVNAVVGANNPRVLPIIAMQIGSGNNNVKNFALAGSNLKNNFTITSTVTFTPGTPCVINWTGNGFGSGAIQTSFTSTGSLPTGITSGQLYFIVNFGPFSNTFNLANTQGGSPIACSGTPSGTATGSYINTIYNAAIGQDYSTKPNRPVDFARITGGAPYSNGSNMCDTSDAGCGAVLPAATAPFWQNLVTTWETNPTSSNTAALNLIDYDLRWGRVAGTIQNVTWDAVNSRFQTPLAHGFAVNNILAFEVTGGTIIPGTAIHTVYCVASVPTSATFTIRAFSGGMCTGSTVTGAAGGTGTTTVGTSPYQNLMTLSGTFMQLGEGYAETFNGDRPAGVANLINAWYEGAVELPSLNATQCNALGIVTNPPDGTGATCASETAAVVLAYKNSTLARQLEYDYMACGVGLLSDCVMTFGVMPNAKWTSNLTLYGSSIYALSPTLTGTPYGWYNGFRDFNNLNLNFLLKRDLDPASNDNDPMWLEKSA